VLTPVLRPPFRWHHNWAIARAMEGLEPYVQARQLTSRSEHDDVAVGGGVSSIP
jgi:hypothetical protein